MLPAETGKPVTEGNKNDMEKEKNKRKYWTTRYAVINATYFMGFCGVHAYASIFMLERGFTNSRIGLLIALANIFSVLIQPAIAGVIDKQGRLTNRRAASACTAMIIVLSLVLAFVQQEKLVIFIVFMLIYMIQMAYQPIIIAMNFEYAGKGCSINFGLARGLGSMGFAVYSPVIGNLLEKHSVSVIHIGDALVLTIGLLFLLTFRLPESSGMLKEEERKDKEAGRREEKGKRMEAGQEFAAHNNFPDFAKHYPGFMLFLLAVILVFFAHNMINDYLIQIITPLGGTENHIGYATSMAALLELPTMAFFVKMTKKVSGRRLLQISTVFFTIKVTLLFLATGIAGVFVSQFCQIAAYALFIPASAYYVSEVMERFDQVKGQAYLNCAITLSGTFSGLICGRVLDLAGPKAMLACGVCVSVLGTALAVFAIREKE